MADILPYTKPDGVYGLAARSSLALPTEGPRDFVKYTAAQTNEKEGFRHLLRELGKTLPPSSVETLMGRPSMLMSDMIFAIVYKTYVGLSSRRFMTDLRDVQAMGFIDKAPGHSSVTRFLQQPSVTPVLRSLVEGVAASFAHIETTFAADATGFSIPKITKWYDAKYGWRRRGEWIKCHAMVGTQTHIIAAVEVTSRKVMDHAPFMPLVASTANQFEITDVAADSAYSIIKNIEDIDGRGAYPAIPFRKGTNPFIHAEGSAWRRMYHIFALNGLDWQKRVNRQNQAEATFSMMKRKFGEKIFSKDETAQVNEVLCKVLCHNLTVVLYWVYQFGVEV